MDNTLVMVFSDNGASAEGGKAGSFNEHRFTAHVRESMEDNLAHYDDWGGFTTYNHYSWAWAWAGNTPHKLWKRYTWLGGTRTPLIVHWPGRVAQPGSRAPAVRPRHRPHADDPGGRRPRIPDEVDGVAQQPVDGVSLLSALEDPGAPELHHTQYFEMLGSRPSTTRGGRRRPTTSAPASSTRRSSPWAAATSTRTAGSSSTSGRTSPKRPTAPTTEPERLRQLRDLWDAEAQRNNVLPISDGLVDRFGGFIPPTWPAGLVADVPPGRRRRRRRVGAAAVGRLRHHGRHRHATGDRGRRRRLRAGRLVRRLRPLPRRGRAHFTFARAADALELAPPSAPRSRPPRDRGLLRGRATAARRSHGPAGRRGRGRRDRRGGDAPARASSTAARGCGWAGTAGSPCPRVPCRRRASKGTVHGVRVDTPGSCAPTRRARCAPRSTPTERGRRAGLPQALPAAAARAWARCSRLWRAGTAARSTVGKTRPPAGRTARCGRDPRR